MPTAILDIDGTLIDSNYHHVLAWDRALASCGANVPLWKLHRHMGMGGDQIVEAVAGAGFEREHGDDVRAAERRFYAYLMPGIRAVEGATEAIASLGEAGWTVILASSARSSEVDHYVEMLDAGGLAAGTTDSGEVGQTKPAPDLVEAALERVHGDDAFMAGDSVWDIEAAGRAGLRSIAVLSGGFPEQDLIDAGAAEVIESVVDLPAAAGRLRNRGLRVPAS